MAHPWPDCRSTPTPEYRYWLYSVEGCGLMFFRSKDERNKAAQLEIDAFCDDEWAEGVEAIYAGEVELAATQCNRRDRPPEDELDEGFGPDGDYWPEGVDYTCDYEMRPLPPLPPEEPTP